MLVQGRQGGRTVHGPSAAATKNRLGLQSKGRLYRMGILDDRDRKIDVYLTAAVGTPATRLLDLHKLPSWFGFRPDLNRRLARQRSRPRHSVRVASLQFREALLLGECTVVCVFLTLCTARYTRSGARYARLSCHSVSGLVLWIYPGS